MIIKRNNDSVHYFWLLFFHTIYFGFEECNKSYVTLRGRPQTQVWVKSMKLFNQGDLLLYSLQFPQLSIFIQVNLLNLVGLCIM